MILFVGIFFNLGRKYIVDDQRLNRSSFEAMAIAFFMMIIWEIALLLIGSWGIAKDRIMKANWAIFTIVYLALFSIFRQHEIRIKFDTPSLKDIVDPPTTTCDDDCQ